MAADGKRMIYEGQLVQAAIDIPVKGNTHVSIDPSSMLKKPENCAIARGMRGVVSAIQDSKLLVKFRPGSSDMVALWFNKSVVATQLHLFDEMQTS